MKEGFGMLFGTEWWQVALAVVVYFGLGALWYSPALLGKQWARELGKKPGEMTDPKTAMLVTFLSMLLLVLVTSYFVNLTGTLGLFAGAKLGAKLWLGFVFTTAIVNNVFQNGSKRLFAIDQGYHLVGMVLAAAILAV